MIRIIRGVIMKIRLNLTIDEDLIPKTKKYAKSHGISLSQLVEDLLRDTTLKEKSSFSSKWKGQFKLVEKDESRYKKMKERYLK